MCQTRKHDYYIDYLQGLANEAVMAEQRQATIDAALALPLEDRVELCLRLLDRLAPGHARRWRRERQAASGQQAEALNQKSVPDDKSAVLWKIENLAEG